MKNRTLHVSRTDKKPKDTQGQVSHVHKHFHHTEREKSALNGCFAASMTSNSVVSINLGDMVGYRQKLARIKATHSYAKKKVHTQTFLGTPIKKVSLLLPSW